MQDMRTRYMYATVIKTYELLNRSCTSKVISTTGNFSGNNITSCYKTCR